MADTMIVRIRWTEPVSAWLAALYFVVVSLACIEIYGIVREICSWW